MQPFFNDYLEGRTPSPCIDCNSYVKFGALLGRALRELDCDAVATGHYARVDALEDADAAGGRRYRLLTGLDADKDQSYFLYGLRQDQLARTIFPLGDLTKPEVRDVARRHGLVTADKPESQEICFVPGGDYRNALATKAGWHEQPGPLVDADGVAVGEHRGAAAYTVGQRQGLGVALGEPRYVSRIDAATNVVTLGRREDLYRSEFALDRVSFVAGRAPGQEFRTSVRIRHRAAPVPGTAFTDTAGVWRVRLDSAAWAPAPGQAAVFYEGDEVVGGGRISAA
jgi:tRNA-specific 2-thiouridylase